MFMRFTQPLAFSRPLQLMAAFAFSGLYHVVLYHPFTHSFVWWPHMTFWLGCGTGCLLERAFYKVTGKRVEGWWGRLWFWSWIILVSQPQVRFELESGWVSRARAMALERPEERVTNHILALVGIGPMSWLSKTSSGT